MALAIGVLRCLEIVSVPLPGGNGTTTVILREGKGSAKVIDVGAANATDVSNALTASLLSIVSRLAFRLG